MPRRKSGQRAIGPYPDRGGYRVIEIAPSGARTSHVYTSKARAIACRDEFNSVPTTVGVTVGEALAEYEQYYLTERGNKPTSWPETRRRILALLGTNTELDTLTSKTATEIYRRYAASGISVDSHRGCLTTVKTFFGWAVAKHYVSVNPFTDVAPIGRKRKGKPKLRRDEARAFADGALALLAETTDRVTYERYLMALTALYLGARSSEITLRQVRDIDGDCTLYVIPDSKTPSGRRTERIPEELQPFYHQLVEGRAGTEPLFPGRYGKPHDHRYVTRYCVAPLCEALGLPRVTAHGMRGTFADLALEEGTASLAVARSLGQKSIGVLHAHYAGKQAIADGKSRKALERLRSTNRL